VKKLSDKDIYIHLGLPKTGSTYLQREVFPRFDGIHYIKKRHFYNHTGIISASNAQKYLLSHECIIKANTIGLIRDNRRIAALAENYPEAKIILFFRRHDSWIKSRYYYYIRKNGYRTFDEFLDINNDNGLLKLEKLEFKRDIALVEDFFTHKPCILFHEELIKNPQKVITYLAQIMGVTFNNKRIPSNPVNVAFNPKQLKIIRRFNSLFRYRPSKNRYKPIRSIHRNMRKLAIHTIGLLSLGIPDFLFTDNTPLIPDEKLEQLRKQFDNDWHFCLNYAQKQRELFF